MKKKISRILAFTLSAVMIVSQLPFVSAAGTYHCSECGDNGVKGELQHEIAATCGKDGFKIYACDNGDCKGTITEKVAATGVHTTDGKTVAAVPATCTENGTMAYQLCTGCGCYLVPGTATKLDSIVVTATGHTYSDVVTPPTCTDEGYTTHTCSNCNYSYVDSKVPARGHDYSVTIPAKPATCKEEGYTEYRVCADCGAEDPEHKKQVVPVKDHNLKLIDHQDPTCVTDGYNKFKCDEPTCPYYTSITEVIAKTGHNIVHHDAKTATCTEGGYGAYDTCTKCSYSTYDPSTEVAPLGHTYVSKGYIAPTCTEEGCTDAIVCDRCGLIHHQGETIAPLGHNLVDVAAVPATCTSKGKIAHKKCTVCGKLFATTVENDDINAVPLSSIDTPALNHKYNTIVINPTCTEVGYKVHTCTNDGCNYTYSEPISAKGHNFEVVAEVAAKCGVQGKKAHKRCKTCGKLYDINADKTSTTSITAADLIIPALLHVPETVEFEKPTYDKAGHEAGQKCSLCGESLVSAADIPELEENVKFHFDVKGVNNAATAVNSGYITVNVYFDVIADDLDNADYNSDVLANIYGVDYTLDFDKTAFELKTVTMAVGAFDNAAFTPKDTANANGRIAITQDMSSGKKVFRGKNLFATLVFQVAANATAADYTFTNSDLRVIHSDGETIDTSATVTAADITVEKLGDANGDGQFDSNDTLAMNKFIKNSNDVDAYVAKYDMDKDGFITFTDIDLLRKAIVGNNEYLGITVVPNLLIAQEVNRNES